MKSFRSCLYYVPPSPSFVIKQWIDPTAAAIDQLNEQTFTPDQFTESLQSLSKKEISVFYRKSALSALQTYLSKASSAQLKESLSLIVKDSSKNRTKAFALFEEIVSVQALANALRIALPEGQNLDEHIQATAKLIHTYYPTENKPAAALLYNLFERSIRWLRLFSISFLGVFLKAHEVAEDDAPARNRWEAQERLSHLIRMIELMLFAGGVVFSGLFLVAAHPWVGVPLVLTGAVAAVALVRSAANVLQQTPASIGYKGVCENLNRLVENDSTLDSLVGRSTEVIELSKQLGGPNSNIFLLGKTGVGKTEIVKELARIINKGGVDCPSALQGKTIFRISAPDLQGREFASWVLDEILEQAKKHEVILFFDEAHKLFASEGIMQQQTDWSQKFKNALEGIPCILATTKEEFDKFNISSDAPFMRRFPCFKIEEFSAQNEKDREAIALILQQKAARLYPGIQIEKEAIEQAITLSSQEGYLESSSQPSKAWGVLEAALKAVNNTLYDQPSYFDYKKQQERCQLQKHQLLQKRGPAGWFSEDHLQELTKLDEATKVSQGAHALVQKKHQLLKEFQEKKELLSQLDREEKKIIASLAAQTNENQLDPKVKKFLLSSLQKQEQIKQITETKQLIAKEGMTTLVTANFLKEVFAKKKEELLFLGNANGPPFGMYI